MNTPTDDDRLMYSSGGYTYVMRLAPSRQALRCGFRVAAALAPVMSGISRLKNASGAFAAAMTYLFQNPQTEENVIYLVDAFAPYTEVIVDGSNPPVTFTLGNKVDQHFAGKQDALLDWLGRACNQNLASFLGGLLAKAKDAEAALVDLGVAAKSSESPSPAEKSG